MTKSPREVVLSVVREASEPLTAAEISDRLGLHITTVRHHLRNLAGAGEVITVSLKSDGAGRPRLGYRPVAAVPVDGLLTAIFDQLGTTEAARAAAGVAAGRAWAAKYSMPTPTFDVPDPVAVVTEALGRLGFQVSGIVSAFGDHEITLCSCPLRTVSERHPEIARGVAQGAIEYALEATSSLLTGQYGVTVVPAPSGNCEISLRLSRCATASTRTS